MKQAKVLTEAERQRLLAVITNDRHSERNRLAVMLSHLAGLRVGEIAALRVSDIVDNDGQVRDQLRLRLQSLWVLGLLIFGRPCIWRGRDRGSV